MLKTGKQLNKSEKLLLIEAIRVGKVDRKTLTTDTLFAFGYKDFFHGLQVASSPGNKEVRVICLADARKAEETVSDLL